MELRSGQFRDNDNSSDSILLISIVLKIHCNCELVVEPTLANSDQDLWL